MKNTTTSLFICEYCSKNIVLKSKTSVQGHYAKCSPRSLLIKQYLTKENLLNLYCIKGKSANEIAMESPIKNVSTYFVIRTLKLYGIETRSIKEANNSPLVKNKRASTLLSNTGFPHNFCKGSDSRNKQEKKLLDLSGVSNVFQLDFVKIKSLKTISKKYHVENPGQYTLKYGRKVYSKIHREVVEFLQYNNINIGIEFKVFNEHKKVLYSYDIIVSGTNKLIEVNGDYWHGNPILYKCSDLILKGTSNEYTVESKWKKDENKHCYIRSQGYDLLVVWEYDWKNYRNKMEEIILDYIKC